MRLSNIVEFVRQRQKHSDCKRKSEEDNHAELSAKLHSDTLAVRADLGYLGSFNSIGSGPACWLARRRPCRALVLHAPVLSGLRVVLALPLQDESRAQATPVLALTERSAT